MARRRKVVAPSAADLDGIKAEFRRETLSRPSAAMAPISQVAADAAQAHPAATTEERAEIARNSKDAVTHRTAVKQGRVIDRIALDQIDDLALVRDRTVIDPAEMTELKIRFLPMDCGYQSKFSGQVVTRRLVSFQAIVASTRSANCTF